MCLIPKIRYGGHVCILGFSFSYEYVHTILFLKTFTNHTWLTQVDCYEVRCSHYWIKLKNELDTAYFQKNTRGLYKVKFSLYHRNIHKCDQLNFIYRASLFMEYIKCLHCKNSPIIQHTCWFNNSFISKHLKTISYRFKSKNFWQKMTFLTQFLGGTLGRWNWLIRDDWIYKQNDICYLKIAYFIDLLWSVESMLLY